ncbi:MAG: cupin domain-containing protein [Deltaproteobacteria bacterium]|nr:cupin domain-containing protein [Candidatus Zymogenaceae bacterium]
MKIIKSQKKPDITAADQTPVKELLSPTRDGVGINYSLALARLPRGEKNLPHRLKTSSEVYILTEGRGVMHIGDEAAEVSAGDLVFIPPGALQWIENTGDRDLVFYCIVDPPWRAEDESVIV